MTRRPPENPARILVLLPTWVGDAVMASPTLVSLRRLYPHAHITALARDNLLPLLAPAPWCDRLLAARPGLLRQARLLGQERFDLAVLLPNSFRSALLAWLAGARRRVGYARDGRSALLTDRLRPPRRNFRLVPYPTVQYYLDIARYLGDSNPDPAMRLYCRPEDEQQADRLFDRAGLSGHHPLVLLNPGAKFGHAKMWPTERFAELADCLIERHHARILLNGSPAERPILDRLHAAARHDLVDLPRLGSNLALLKSIIRRCDLMITNDTGPRHIAAALGVPVVTLFGPTDPRWTTINFDREIELRIDVDCGPCQKKICPLDHRCMTGLTVPMVLDAAEKLLHPKIHPPDPHVRLPSAGPPAGT